MQSRGKAAVTCDAATTCEAPSRRQGAPTAPLRDVHGKPGGASAPPAPAKAPDVLIIQAGGTPFEGAAAITAANVDAVTCPTPVARNCKSVADQVADWEAADRAATVRDVLAELYGPQELATILSTTTQNVHQMAHRGRLPMADLIVSKVPLWHADTLRAAGIMREEA